MRRYLAPVGLALLLIALGTAFSAWQKAARSAAPLLPVTFAHNRHTGIRCVTCHHNYVDHTGLGLCFDCHKNDPSVADKMESQFHELCWGCHVERQLEGEPHGPTRACNGCHEADDEP